jgi:hypothetical protein
VKKEMTVRLNKKRMIMIQFQIFDVLVSLTPVTAFPDSRKFGYWNEEPETALCIRQAPPSTVAIERRKIPCEPKNVLVLHR